MMRLVVAARRLSVHPPMMSTAAWQTLEGTNGFCMARLCVILVQLCMGVNPTTDRIERLSAFGVSALVKFAEVHGIAQWSRRREALHIIAEEGDDSRVFVQ